MGIIDPQNVWDRVDALLDGPGRGGEYSGVVSEAGYGLRKPARRVMFV
jgi:hypothetical protein